MPLKNTRERYGSVAKVFHWIIALLIIGMLAAGFIMHEMDPAPLKFKIYNWHKSIGFIILWLVGLRLVWRFYNVQPRLLSQKKWEIKLAQITHFLLYVCLFLMPMSGWLMSSADTYPDPLVYGINLPQIVQPDESFKRAFSAIHFYTAWTLVGLIVLHFAGAIKHHFVEKDRTLLRMLPFTKD